MLEEAAHAFWQSRELAHVADEVAFEFCPTACGRPRGDAPLDVAVDSFVQIEFRAVSGQVVYLDLGAVLRQPRLDGSGAMHRQPVHDQEHLAPGVADQALEEHDQYHRGQRAVQDHPSQLPSLVTAEITPTLARFWHGRTSGV